MRTKPGAHLSQTGVDLARLVARDMPGFDRVVTSSIPRAIETAIAMGFAVDEEIEALGHLPRDVFDAIAWPRPLGEIARGMVQAPIARAYAEELAHIWRDLVKMLPAEGRCLVITHGGFIELGLLATLPGHPPDAWGDAFGYCEGVSLTYDAEGVSAVLLRVPPEYRLIEN